MMQMPPSVPGACICQESAVLQGNPRCRTGYLCRGQLTQWDVFMRQMQPLASQVPWMLVEGVSLSTRTPASVSSRNALSCLKGLTHQYAWPLA